MGCCFTGLLLSLSPVCDVICELLQGLNLHGDVEPVDDMRGWLRHGARQPLQYLRAIREHGDFTASGVTLMLESLQSSGPHVAF
jgi:hypothetical protein